MSVGDAPELSELLLALRSPDSIIRANAARALSELEDGVRAITPLLEACRDEDMYVRGEAVTSLWEIALLFWDDKAAAAKPRLVAGLPILIAMLDDQWWKNRCSAMTMLKELGPVAASALPRLRAVFADESPRLAVLLFDWSLETQVRLIRESAADTIETITGWGPHAEPAPTPAANTTAPPADS